MARKVIISAIMLGGFALAGCASEPTTGDSVSAFAVRSAPSISASVTPTESVAVPAEPKVAAVESASPIEVSTSVPVVPVVSFVPTVPVPIVSESTTEETTAPVETAAPVNNWNQIVNKYGAYDWECDNTLDCSNPPTTNVCLFADNVMRMCHTGASITPYPLYNEDGSVVTIVGNEFPINGGGWTPNGVDAKGNLLVIWHSGLIN